MKMTVIIFASPTRFWIPMDLVSSTIQSKFNFAFCQPCTEYIVQPVNIFIHIIQRKFWSTYYSNKWMNVRNATYLKLHSNSIMLWFTQWSINYKFKTQTSTLYWKCLATKIVLLFRKFQRSWYGRFEISNSASFSFCIISKNSFHLRSVRDNVRKNVGALTVSP